MIRQNRSNDARPRRCWRASLARQRRRLPRRQEGRARRARHSAGVFRGDRLRRRQGRLLQEARRQRRDPPVRQRHRRGARRRLRRHRHRLVADAAASSARFPMPTCRWSASMACRTRIGCSARPTGKSNCKDIDGQPVGVDSVGGARSIALRSMLARLLRREDRRRPAGRARLECRPGDGRRPAQIRRAASRRSRRHRGAGQEAQPACWR